MPLDTSIYSRIRPIEMPSQLDTAGKFLTLQNLLNQGKMQDLQMQQGQMSMEQARAKAAKDAELVDAINKMTPEQAKDPLFARNLILKHGTVADVAKYLAEERAANKPVSIGSGGLRMPGGEIIPPTARPQTAQPQQPSSLSRLLAERDALPEGDPRRAIYDQGITHATNPQQQRIIVPPQQPAAHFERGVDEQGRQVVHVFDRKGQLIRTTPLETKPAGNAAAAARKSASDAEAEQTVASVRNRIAKLSTLVQQNPTAVGLAGAARQIGEMVAGVGESLGGPVVPTPALDFANEQALLLADVRKMVEKDPNLSKDERERLYQTIGGGIRQTPSSAIRAMNYVLQFVEGKKLTGGSRQAPKQIQNDAEFQQLPSGTEFIAPDGSRRRKP